MVPVETYRGKKGSDDADYEGCPLAYIDYQSGT
jgi:hypothetical protein